MWATRGCGRQDMDLVTSSCLRGVEGLIGGVVQLVHPLECPLRLGGGNPEAGSKAVSSPSNPSESRSPVPPT